MRSIVLLISLALASGCGGGGNEPLNMKPYLGTFNGHLEQDGVSGGINAAIRIVVDANGKFTGSAQGTPALWSGAFRGSFHEAGRNDRMTATWTRSDGSTATFEGETTNVDDESWEVTGWLTFPEGREAVGGGFLREGLP